MTPKHLGLTLLLIGIALFVAAFKASDGDTASSFQSGRFLIGIGGLLFGAVFVVAGLAVAIFG